MFSCPPKWLGERAPEWGATAKPGVLPTHCLDFLLFSQIQIKHDRKTMTKKKTLQVQNHFYPAYKSQRRMTLQVRSPSGFGGYLHDLSHLLTAVEPRGILPESKRLWLSVSAEGTNHLFLSIWCYAYLLRICFVQAWGSKGQSYSFLTKRAGSMPGASQYLISHNDRKRSITVFSCYDEKTQRG